MRMFPTYSTREMCGGGYALVHRYCEWQVTHVGDHVVARMYNDPRFEGQEFVFGTRREALEALADMIFTAVVA